MSIYLSLEDATLVHPPRLSEASKPFIDAITARLQSGSLDQTQIKNVTAEINNLRQRGRLTDLQAQRIHAQFATLTARAAAQPTGAIRIRQVQALAQLRQTGALSETEFQAEKARMLGATPAQ